MRINTNLRNFIEHIEHVFTLKQCLISLLTTLIALGLSIVILILLPVLFNLLLFLFTTKLPLSDLDFIFYIKFLYVLIRIEIYLLSLEKIFGIGFILLCLFTCIKVYRRKLVKYI